MKDKMGFYGIIEGEKLFIEVKDMNKFIEGFQTHDFKQLIKNIEEYTLQNKTLMHMMQQNVFKSTDSKGKNNTKKHTLLLNKIVFQNDCFLAEISKLTKGDKT